MDGSIVDFDKILKLKKKKQQEIEELRNRIKELNNNKFWIEKEIQIAEFLIFSLEKEISPQAVVTALIEHELRDLDKE